MKLEDSAGVVVTPLKASATITKLQPLSSKSVKVDRQSFFTSEDKSTYRAILQLLSFITYDLVLWFFSFVIHTFFRDIQPRGTFHIPHQGPVIFVIAPHHNQFIDPLIVMSKVKQFIGRRIAFIIANKSYKQRFIGTMAMLCGVIPVERPQDLVKPASGKIRVNPDNEIEVIGEGTKFTTECMEKGLVGLPEYLGNVQILSIQDDTHLILKKKFESARPENQARIDKLLREGTKYKVAPHIDNSVVFKHVFNHLNSGRVLGIFPEGGSHDRPDLLPLKPGVAIMALGTVAEAINKLKEGNSDVHIEPVTIIPVGLNYFHPHLFRSRVVVEFGEPIIVDKSMGLHYIESSRAAVGELLNAITLGLKEVTVTCKDYETLMVLQAARRLYTSANRENIPLPMVVELNRRLIKGYEQYKNEPDVIELREKVMAYNSKLRALRLHDHDVETLTRKHRFHTFIVLIERLFKYALFMGLSLPGMILFSPVFIVAIRISNKRAKEALAASVVKIKANDVIGTWKILVALVLAPALYILYSIIGTILILEYNISPIHVPVYIIFLFCYCWALLTTYASLRVGEIGMDYYKSLRPLFLSIVSFHTNGEIEIDELKKTRRELAGKVDEFCNKYGPGMFDDFDEFYGDFDDEKVTVVHEGDEIESSDEEGEHPIYKAGKKGKGMLSRISSVESFNIHNLSDIPIFSYLTDSVTGAGISAKSSFTNLTTIRGHPQSNGDKRVYHNNNNSDFDEDVGLKLRNKLKSKLNNNWNENQNGSD
ncbi:Sct2 glycerol-3-phosphate acyltransferase [Scheffersomyces amazonensis]|uniref:Sct2 glycerol-3-phosphate acyltransferase n=1 Tax=Scheffersomyces amazonensis TaxID=1078765 RepID=UPI00315D95B8